ncbi:MULTISPECIES: DNA polymerase III subunit alpha [Streptomyces]|uniref:DNA polymerase III subunit alpha n=5 Tax=Streptomyces TaxID=1883 RepID=A0A291SMY6_STRMQ|nr:MULTISPECIES: DNA polymerase III subunit alpha [Streptomyces]ATL82231.1 DNA polymerase III subunit alpha [Streptomyces malaysiensis]MCC4322247.1 DNA polymerase III subunit alpha [Streptomyces malaysiensis]MCD9594614.1 DNA polymerase III subunit alpha [Streptomyces sp. 8ZJF_21]MCM3807832.1 DNA polymerase III subunit alpha [Streptomyces sp. DR7-3]PNG96657.1 DNA polymerase III subunit alpha [Streptomyces malaysiensis]
MTKPPFTHLHVHTQYSLLDGAARLKDMFNACNEMGMTHIAMTDHGNLHGAYDFYQQATGAGITPIIGIEAYVAPESRRYKRRVQWGQPHQKRDDVSGSGGYTHKTIWASNKTGLHNLFRLSSDAYMEGYFVKWPRMDKETIAQWSEGLIASTGCPSGELQTRLRLGQFDEALKAASEYQDIFGKDRYFLELMDHGIEIERRVRDGLLEIGKKLDIPPLVTNDSHYTYARESEAHDALLCVQTGKNLSDPDRFRFDGTGYYLKSTDEMYAIDSSDAWQEGCRNTLLVAEQIDNNGWFEKRDLMPRFDVPEGYTEVTWFQEEVKKGMARRFPGGVPEDRQSLAEYEMDVIIQMGFPGYFLVVADFIMWAKNNGIAVGPGRGSAAGSIVSYAMGITDLDPVEHGLIFERFLNPERVSMPDVDIDFDERRRGEVIRYVTEKYGHDKVAQIGTYGTIKAKNAIKDSARVLGYPYAMGDRITKAMPADVLGKGIPLSGITDEKHPRYSEAGEVRGMYENEPDVKKVIDTARGIEGLVRQMGVHAAGVIMSSETVTDHVPVFSPKNDGQVVTQWDYPTCESLGLLKMDFLGLRNLTIMDDAVKMVRANKGIDLKMLDLSLDDPKTFELLCRGDTLGVFQFDGGPMRSLLRMMKPDNFEDISAVSALYRPGPMGMNSHINYALRKNGQQEITPIHPELEEPLKEVLGITYGLIVYQEQVQKAAQVLAGYSLGQADLLRRAMGKKKPEVLEKEFVNFQKGAREKGYSDEAIQAVWDVLVPFAGYAFNKAHSSAYGLVTYWTAYLKANYPAEYMAALLTSVRDDKDKSAVYLNECRRMGIKVLPPNVNESEANFTAQGDDVILFGLTAVRNVGQNVVEAIIRGRKAKGKYGSFPDYLDKVEAVVCNKRTTESLIKAGAFDEMGHTRKGLTAHYEALIDNVVAVKRKEAEGQFDLFGGMGGDGGDGDGPGFGLDVEFSDVEWEKTYLLAQEREMLGLYVSDHPLFGIEHVLNEKADAAISALTGGEHADGAIVTIGGIISGLQRKMTKQGNAWAIATVEDLAGSIECMFFPATYQLVSTQLIEDVVVFVKGRLDKREDVPRLVAMELMVPDLSEAGADAPVTITIPTVKVTPPLVEKLSEVLTHHRGSTEVRIKLQGARKTTVLRLDRHRVTADPALFGDLKVLLGASCLAG